MRVWFQGFRFDSQVDRVYIEIRTMDQLIASLIGLKLYDQVSIQPGEVVGKVFGGLVTRFQVQFSGRAGIS